MTRPTCAAIPAGGRPALKKKRRARDRCDRSSAQVRCRAAIPSPASWLDPLRAYQPQGHTPTTPLKPPSTPFPSATGSARSTAPPPTSIQCGRSVDDMARHAPHRCRIARNPTTVHSARGERLTYRLLQVQRSLSKESQTSAVTCPPQPHNSASRDDQPRPRSLTTTSHPRVSGVLRYPGDLQHRSGQPAHQYRVHGAAAGSGRALFDGRSRSLSGQWVHQAVFIKRLWRSLKYEAVYLHQLADGFMAQRVIDEWSSSPTRCDRARHWMVGRRRPPTAGSRRPDRRWRTGHGGQVAIAGSAGRGPAGAQSDEGSYPQCPPDQAPRPRTPTPFYRHLFLTARGALTITRIYLDLPPAGGPNLPLPTSIEMTPDASAVVTFHRNHWKGSPEYARSAISRPKVVHGSSQTSAASRLRGGASVTCSTSTSAPPQHAVRPSLRNRSTLTCCGIPPPCTCCRRARIPTASVTFSDTQVARPLGATRASPCRRSARPPRLSRQTLTPRASGYRSGMKTRPCWSIWRASVERTIMWRAFSRKTK